MTTEISVMYGSEKGKEVIEIRDTRIAMDCFNTSFFKPTIGTLKIKLQIQNITFQVPVLLSNQTSAQQNVIGRLKRTH